MRRRNFCVVALMALATACAKLEPSDADAEHSQGQQSQVANDSVSGKPDALSSESLLAAEPQARVRKQAGAPQVSTRLTARIHKNGDVDIIDVVELPGYLKLEKHLGRRFVYEASINGVVLAVQGIDADFEQRAVSPERDITLPADTMEVYVDIPGIGVDEAENVELAIHEINGSHEEKFASIDSVARLKKSNRLKRVSLAGGANVRRFIRNNARRVRSL